jgi:hypothetical protein
MVGESLPTLATDITVIESGLVLRTLKPTPTASPGANATSLHRAVVSAGWNCGHLPDGSEDQEMEPWATGCVRSNTICAATTATNSAARIPRAIRWMN